MREWTSNVTYKFLRTESHFPQNKKAPLELHKPPWWNQGLRSRVGLFSDEVCELFPNPATYLLCFASPPSKQSSFCSLLLFAREIPLVVSLPDNPDSARVGIYEALFDIGRELAKEAIIMAELDILDYAFRIDQDEDGNAVLIIGPDASRLSHRVSPVGPGNPV